MGAVCRAGAKAASMAAVRGRSQRGSTRSEAWCPEMRPALLSPQPPPEATKAWMPGASDSVRGTPLQRRGDDLHFGNAGSRRQLGDREDYFGDVHRLESLGDRFGWWFHGAILQDFGVHEAGTDDAG